MVSRPINRTVPFWQPRRGCKAGEVPEVLGWCKHQTTMEVVLECDVIGPRIEFHGLFSEEAHWKSALGLPMTGWGYRHSRARLILAGLENNSWRHPRDPERDASWVKSSQWHGLDVISFFIQSISNVHINSTLLFCDAPSNQPMLTVIPLIPLPQILMPRDISHRQSLPSPVADHPVQFLACEAMTPSFFPRWSWPKHGVQHIFSNKLPVLGLC